VGVVSWVYKRRRREIVYCKRSSLVFLYTALWRRIHSQLIHTMHPKRTLARWLRIYVWSIILCLKCHRFWNIFELLCFIERAWLGMQYIFRVLYGWTKQKLKKRICIESWSKAEYF
jgi:hypothetical protein